MLRLLARTVARLWDRRPGETRAQLNDRVLEWYPRSEQELALAIQQCYRHVLYPSRNRVEGAGVDLAHTAIDVQTASDKPGNGQKQVVEVLRANNKLRLPEDEPDSPTYIRDRTLLKKGTITTASLRAEFRRDPALPILVGDDVFVKAIRRGIELGEYVYQSGDLTCGKGDPWANIHIDEQCFVHTAAYAKSNGIWPKVAEPSGPTAGGTTDAGADTTGGPARRQEGQTQARASSAAAPRAGPGSALARPRRLHPNRTPSPKRASSRRPSPSSGSGRAQAHPEPVRPPGRCSARWSCRSRWRSRPCRHRAAAARSPRCRPG
jgi:hypothetical protein